MYLEQERSSYKVDNTQVQYSQKQVCGKCECERMRSLLRHCGYFGMAMVTWLQSSRFRNICNQFSAKNHNREHLRTMLSTICFQYSLIKKKNIHLLIPLGGGKWTVLESIGRSASGIILRLRQSVKTNSQHWVRTLRGSKDKHQISDAKLSIVLSIVYKLLIVLSETISPT